MSFYYKETFPIVLVPLHWAPLWSGLKLFVKTDSQAAAAILNKGSNFCPVIMSWIHSLFWLKKYENFSLFIRHIQEQPAPWQIVFYPLMMCTTGQRSKHGSPHPLDRMTLNLTCRHCLLLSLDPRDQQQLGHEVTNFWHQTYALTTKSTYMSQVHSHLFFCGYYGYQPLSAAALTLNRYATFPVRALSASSIPSYLNVACILHLEHGLTDPTKNNFQLATTLQGIKPAKGLTTVFQKKPITPQILLAFKSHLNLDNPLQTTFSTETYNTFVPR